MEFNKGCGGGMKKIKPVFYSFNEPGKKTKFENLKLFHVHVRSLKGRIKWTVEEYKEKRSNPQNSYYWGIIVKMLGNHFGYTKKETHSAIGQEFLLVERDGKPPFVRSTSDLNTHEFAEFNEQVKIWAVTNFGVVIPDPEAVDIR